MNKLTKAVAGAVTAATLTVSLAAPAEAQRYRGDYYGDRYYGRDRGIDTGDIIAGVAVLGGIAAITSALSRDRSRYGYQDSYRYRDGYRYAVNSCASEAQRAGGGQVRITDVDRTRGNSYRVRGVVESGYGGGYYDRGYGYDRDYGYDRGYNRGNYGERFTCVAYDNGRIRDFRLNNGYASRY
jgi:hypothetical protein